MLPDINTVFNQAIQNFQNGNLEDAKKKLTYILNVQPRNIVALEMLGVVHVNLGNHLQALKHFERITKFKPDYANAWSNRANVLQELKKFEQALASYDKAISIKPDFADAWSNRGNVLKDLKQYEKALISYDKAISIKPDYVEAWSNRGAVLHELRQYEQALASYEKALNFNPDFAKAWFNIGVTLKELKQYEQALFFYNKAISIEPDYVEAWSNRGAVLQELREYEQSLTSFDKAISLKPNFASAWSNRGYLFTTIGKFADAEASYRKAILLDPDLLDAYSNLLFSLNYCETLSPEIALNEAIIYGSKISAASQPKFSVWNENLESTKLKIGFVSGDFRNHPVGYFLEGLFEKLDQNRFELFAFPTVSNSDELTERLKMFLVDWVPIYNMSDRAAASLIHRTGIQVLFDLAGHTADNKLPIFSYKPAPIQVSWLGYFATTGLPEMDYFIGDPHMSPSIEESHFTETVWKLAETWLCRKPPINNIQVSDLPAQRNGFLTFGSFGNLSKMNDQVVETWASILRRSPTSRLFLKSIQFDDPDQVETVKNRFQVFEISADRLILEESDSTNAYYEAYKRVDLILDTFPYPGGTTSLDALWMGNPILTLKGNRFLSHLGESIAINAGLLDWIAKDIDDYINKAVEYASDFDRLAQVRCTLRDQVLRSPLFDTPSFAKNFGDALLGMWNRRIDNSFHRDSVNTPFR